VGLGGDYLAHALLEVRGEAAGGDGASAVHAVDEVGGHGGEHLAKYIDHPLVPSATADGAAALLGPRVVAGGPGAELLLLGVDAAVEAQARDAVALGGHVHHRGLEKLLEAGQRELGARADRGVGGRRHGLLRAPIGGKKRGRRRRRRWRGRSGSMQQARAAAWSGRRLVGAGEGRRTAALS
jgi:hypothetical protein